MFNCVSKADGSLKADPNKWRGLYNKAHYFMINHFNSSFKRDIRFLYITFQNVLPEILEV